MPLDPSLQTIPRREFLGGLGLAAGSTLLGPSCQSQSRASLFDLDAEALVSAADLIYLSPAAEPVEGHPIGNGRMGTLVWTEPETCPSCRSIVNDVFAVNRNHKGARDGPADYCGGCAQVQIDFWRPCI